MARTFRLGLVILIALSILAIATASHAQTLNFCAGNRSKDLLELTSIDLTPDPIQRGAEANMTVVGHLKSTVEKGSVIKVLFKLGPIKLLDTTLDLCESIEKIGKSCPLPAGETVLSHKFTVPNEIPPGKFSAQIELRNKDSSVISCLSANLRL